MHISSNTTIYEVICYLLYVKHNYMFRAQMLAIFRLYNENLSVSYTCVCKGFIGCREGCKCEISQVWGGGVCLGFGLLGTIRRQNCVYYKYVYKWFLTNPNPRHSPHLRDLALTPPCTLYTPPPTHACITNS
jgi:hypothetical protein